MARKFAVDLNLLTNQLLQACLENLASAPAHKAGRIYFDTTIGQARVSDGTSWGRASFVTDPFARANHTGSQLAATISDFDTQVRTNRLDQMSAPTAAVSLGSQKITNLATPTADTDAATKAYADAVGNGLDVKVSVRAATTANISLTGTQTIDGVAVIAGDRVLVKDQSTGANNGIYVAAAGAWQRSTDADTSAEVTPGLFTFVEEGTVNADSAWILTTNAPITLATTALVFAQFSGAGSITAGAGLTKTGNTLDVIAVVNGGITVNADDIAIDTAVVARKFAVSIGDGAALAYVVTHNLNTRDVVVSVWDNTTPFAEIVVDVEHTTVNTVTVRFSVAPTTNQYRVSVIG